LAVLVATVLLPLTNSEAAQNYSWDFAPGKTLDFTFERTGGGAPGSWSIVEVSDAPRGPSVLAQLDRDRTDYRFPLAIANRPILRDVSLSVECKSVAGDIDQACGLVVRYRDPGNYYVVRANALENNVNLYRVVNGNRRQIAGWSGAVPKAQWNALRLDARGMHFSVYWQNRRILDADDATFSAAGRIGLWTKADSVTYFSALAARDLQ
jgi:hypothetical protein